MAGVTAAQSRTIFAAVLVSMFGTRDLSEPLFRYTSPDAVRSLSTGVFGTSPWSSTVFATRVCARHAFSAQPAHPSRGSCSSRRSWHRSGESVFSFLRMWGRRSFS